MADWLLQYSWDRRPPRKIRTAYSYFIRDHYRKTRQRLGTRSSQDIFRALGQIWRNMGPEERSAYRAQELDDRKRYADAYTHWVRYYPGRIPRMRRRIKPKDAPIRTRNAFIMYERDVWPQMRNEFPSWSQQELVHEASKRWKRLTVEEKEPYKGLAEQDKKRYLNEIIAYRRERWTLHYRKQAEKYENRLVELREQKAQLNAKKMRDRETAAIPS